MKKTKKLVLCILIIALITLSSITAYAAMCSHGWDYWDINETKHISILIQVFVMRQHIGILNA